MVAKKLNCKQAWYLLYLTRFDSKLYHHSNRSMGKSDALLQRLDYDIGFYNNQNLVLIKLEFFAIWVTEDIIVRDEEKALMIDRYLP